MLHSCKQIYKLLFTLAEITVHCQVSLEPEITLRQRPVGDHEMDEIYVLTKFGCIYDTRYFPFLRVKLAFLLQLRYFLSKTTGHHLRYNLETVLFFM